MMKKPKVAFFDFACCEGCQLQVTNMGETLLDLLGIVDVVEFREAMSEKWEGEYDIAIIEGSTIGGVNGMKNNFKLKDIRKEVYGEDYQYFDTIKTRAVHQVVKVDYFVHGCPVYIPEFLKVMKAVLAGLPYQVPDYSVCVECKLNENVCMYDRGLTCLGPITRAGCNSWCINNNNICYGCRGMVSNPNENGAKDVIEKYNIPMAMILNKMNMYNKCRELDEDNDE